ncbi:hypothetical protein N9F21_04130 [Porticoccaceae bacterium]|nr:hypothetical protein [Porticoccaceae bacterium]
MKKTSLQARLGLIRILIIILLLGLSCYFLIIRTLWLFSPVAWWLYQIAHFILFSAAVMYLLKPHKYRIFTIVFLSIIIGFMPYDLWVLIVSDFNLDELSSFTEGIPVFWRVAFEFGFYPILEFLLLLGVNFAVGRENQWDQSH